MRKFSDDELDGEILKIMKWHVGKDAAITRWQLVREVFGLEVPAHLQNDDNKEDRAIRLSVSRLRSGGHLICDLGNGSGRYLAANEGEFWELYNYYAKPLIARAQILRKMKNAAEMRWPNVMQPSLFANFDERELQ